MGGNTLLLFVRTVIVTLCGAVAVRLAIAALGVDGYGTYATAMGVVGLFMLFKGALEQTARRVVSHEFGLGASGDVLAAGQPAWTAMAAVAASNGGALAYRYLHVRLLMGLRPSFAVLRASSPESAQSDS